ncbi:MAG: hypothetical protein EAY75_01170 [Bacteroidetes bacterium]|nr:MAG: hypothetical protein EAY75_01170 [Bacteroidota bacterium]
MSAQFSKLTVICNICFWLVLGVRYVNVAVLLPHAVVSTVVVMATMALIINLLWMSRLFFVRLEGIAPPWIIFNGVTGIAQLISILVFLL